ncbi:MAG: IS110 family transposase [Acetobacteraceae bacterium]|jgi:transposase
MTNQTAAPNAPAAYDPNSTLAIALELSGKSWELGAVVPGLTRRPRRRLDPRDMAGLLQQVERWKTEAGAAGRTIVRVVLTYEAGRDGFWIARHLIARGIEVHIMHPASIPVARKKRRAKTDRIDLEMLLRSLLAWLRGDPMSCSMVAIPSEAVEDQRRPGRERERLVSERIALENRMQNLLCLHGVPSFKPRLKKAAAQLEALRRFDGEPLPTELMAELRRLLARHQLLSEQLKAIEAARETVLTAEQPDLAAQQIRALAILYGLGLGTATDLAREVFCRSFRDRQAIASFVGMTGTPFNSGGSEREQGISKSGNPRVRRLLMQLAWRWLRLQPQSELSRWFQERTGGAKGRIRKVMAVALARKLLVALWRYLQTGVLPAGARTTTPPVATNAAA